jgi:hypothetical protein
MQLETSLHIPSGAAHDSNLSLLTLHSRQPWIGSGR